MLRVAPASGVIVALAALATFTLACGAAKLPDAKTERQSAAAEQAHRIDVFASPAASNISISDEIRSKCGIPDADAYFAFDSARVDRNDHSPLDLVAKCFTIGPLKGRSMKLIGHADPRGEAEYNLTLGQSRADAVSTYLKARGVSADKAQTTSRGALDARGTDETTWQKDRRVDVVLGG
jgi:peptidoglycan-associated lipoprotein